MDQDAEEMRYIVQIWHFFLEKNIKNIIIFYVKSIFCPLNFPVYIMDFILPSETIYLCFHHRILIFQLRICFFEAALYAFFK
mgnify:CR=1 FL=1